MYKKIRHILFTTWVVFILFSVLIPSSLIEKDISFFSFLPYFDKVVHGILFFGFAFLLIPILRERYSLKKSIIINFIISILFAILTEVFQFLSNKYTSRSFDIMDIASDIIGILIANLAYIILRKLLRKREIKLINKIFFN